MNRKKMARAGSLAMSVLMAGAMLATPVFAAGNDPVAETATGAVVIGTTAEANHSYAIVKVMDKYIIQPAAEAVPDNPDTPENEAQPAQEAMYQYKLNSKFSAAIVNGKAVFGEFSVDPATGKITYMAGDPAAEVVLDDENGSALGNNENSSYGAKFATAVAQWCVSHNVAPDKTATGGESVDGLVQGYYVIYETANSSDDGVIATKPVLINLAAENAVSVKPSKVELDKIINDTDAVAQGEDPKELNDYNIGDIVPYQVTTNLPVYEADVDVNSLYFQVKDELSAGLTLQTTGTHAPVVTVTDGNTPVELAEGDVTITTDNNKLIVDFAKTFIKAHQGADIVIDYAAELNANAVISGAGNPNKAVVEFMNNPELASSHKTLEDDAKVYTYAVDFIKLDGTHDVKLAGAKFQLTNADGEVIGLVAVANDTVDVYRPAVAGDAADSIKNDFVTADKEIRFIGLDAGTYFLEELEAPTGFAQIKGKMQFTVTAESQAAQEEVIGVGEPGDPDYVAAQPAVAAVAKTGKAIIASGSSNLVVSDNDDADATTFINDETLHIDMTVKNYEGISLPETGAMTGLIVTGLGAAVVVGGSALFFGRKKKEDEE